MLCAVVCITTLSVAALLFMYSPGEGPQWPVTADVVAMLALGELIIRRAESGQGTPVAG
jgi:glutamate:GABA antiporter